MDLVWITVSLSLFLKCVECSGTGKTLIIYVLLMQWPFVIMFIATKQMKIDFFFFFDASVTFNCGINKLLCVRH